MIREIRPINLTEEIFRRKFHWVRYENRWELGIYCSSIPYAKYIEDPQKFEGMQVFVRRNDNTHSCRIVGFLLYRSPKLFIFRDWGMRRYKKL